MEKHLEHHFFTSKHITKLARFKNEMESLRKKRLFQNDLIEEEINEEPFEEVTQDAKPSRLEKSQQDNFLLLNPPQESQKEAEPITEDAITALTIVQHQVTKQTKANAQFLMLEADVEKAADVFEKSQKKKENQKQQEVSEKEKMQRFLRDFVKTVKEEKEQIDF